MNAADKHEVKVIIPWRPEPSREPGFRWVCAYYRHRLGEDAVHVEVDDSDAPFNRSRAINRGVSRYPNATVVIADADCVITDHALRRAVREADERLVIPHNRRCFTNWSEANWLLSLDPTTRVSGKWFRHRRGRAASAGIWVVRAGLFLKYMMDERFVGWGSEDTEFLRRIPHTRFSGPLFHIKHNRASRAHYPRNKALLREITAEKESDLVPMRTLEYHVSHACNLSCESCSHFSNFQLKGMVTSDDAERDFRLWSGKVRPRRFALLGGEPTINKHLPEIIERAAKEWRHSELMLVTNGWFLHKHPSLPDVLARHNVRLDISVHHQSEEYSRKVREIRELVEADYSDVRVRWRPSYERWRRTYRTGADGRPIPFGGQASKSWRICLSKWCVQLYRGKLWKCPQLAYFHQLDEKLSLQDIKAWDKFREYNPLEPTAAPAEVSEFISRRTESACAVCSDRPRVFELANPIKRSQAAIHELKQTPGIETSAKPATTTSGSTAAS